MKWTALDTFGALARVDDAGGITFSNGQTAQGTNVYVPVFAYDAGAGVGVLAYRDGLADSVRFTTTRNHSGVLAPATVGKWPIGIARLGTGNFLVGWIQPGITSIGLAEINARTGAVQDRGTRTIPAAMVIMELAPDGTARLDNVDTGYVKREITRAGATFDLIYWQEVNGRIVGVDGTTPENRVLLAEPDGWFVADTDAKSALFPPRVDVNGNVTTFEGKYIRNDVVRQDAIAQDNTPRIPPYRSPAGGDNFPLFVLAGALGALWLVRRA